MDRRYAFRTIELRPSSAGGWRLWLGLALAGTAAAAVLLTFGLLFLVLLPAFAVAGLVGRWWLANQIRKATQARPERPAVIEGSYEVIETPPTGGRGWGPRR